VLVLLLTSQRLALCVTQDEGFSEIRHEIEMLQARKHTRLLGVSLRTELLTLAVLVCRSARTPTWFATSAPFWDERTCGLSWSSAAAVRDSLPLWQRTALVHRIDTHKSCFSSSQALFATC
jgi:hypothetical protein